MTGPRLLSSIAVGLAVMCTGLVLVADSPAHAAHLVIRWTARTSVVLFLLAYIARPATQLRPTRVTKRLLAQRKWLGLGFATSHAFHLGGIVALAWPAPAAFVRSQSPTIIVAVIAYLLLFAMAFTSIEAVKRVMPRRAWKWLHRAGMHVAWFVFAVTYVGAIAASPVFVLPVVALAAAVAVRLAARRRGKRHIVTIG